MLGHVYAKYFHTKPRYMIDISTYRQMHSDETDETQLPPQRDDLGQDHDEPPDGRELRTRKVI